MKRSVSIGDRFLREVRSQYEDWVSAFAREALQNCVDAPKARSVAFTVALDGDSTVVTFANDGRPMDCNTLLDKLLTLGESGKEHEGTVGGFGRAKELLYFSAERYVIRTGDKVVLGKGCEYELREEETPYPGTHSKVWLSGDYVEELTRAIKRCVRYSNVRCDFVLNGEELRDRTLRGRRREWQGDSFGSVWTNKSHTNLLLVRVGGVFMFAKKIDYSGCVILELPDSRALTSNRDGLQFRYRQVVEDFVYNLSTNRRKAFKPRAARLTHYVGRKLSAYPAVKKHAEAAPVVDTTIAALVSEAKHALAMKDAGGVDNVTVTPDATVRVVGSANLVFDGASPSGAVETSRAVDVAAVAVRHDFLLCNELCDELKVPVYYDPGSERFSPYSRWLSGVWANLLVELHLMFGRTSEFSLGFVFDDDALARYEDVPGIGAVYYVSPAKVIDRANGRGKMFTPTWNRSDRYTLLATAAHEYVHGEGYGYHNEAFAARYTEVMGKVLEEKSRFAHCFKGV